MIISFLVKSGTGSYYDSGGSDLLIKKIDIENFPIPRIGESIKILEDNDKKREYVYGGIIKEYHLYLIKEVEYWLTDFNDYGVNVYVVPIGRGVNQYEK